MMTYFQYFSLLFFPSKNIYTFTGKEWCKSQWLAQRGPERGISETGFSYFGARYYDSDLSGLFLSVDPMADKYPNISPYAYCAWNSLKYIDNLGLYPKSIVKYDKDAFPRVGGYKLTRPAAHLLSLVSGVEECMINSTVIVKRGPGHYLPWYSSRKGGGAITIGYSSCSSNIILTQNYFEDNPTEYDGNGLGQNIYAWLSILSHEVGHIPQIDKNGGRNGYVINILTEYCKARGHDNAPSEIEAEIGNVIYKGFYKYISSHYGENALSDLFKSDYSDNYKIKKIDEWWNNYKNHQNEE